MWGDKTAVNLELKDLSCDVVADESVQDFEVQISSELELLSTERIWQKEAL